MSSEETTVRMSPHCLEHGPLVEEVKGVRGDIGNLSTRVGRGTNGESLYEQMRNVQSGFEKYEKDARERRAELAARDTKDREFKRALILKVALPATVAVLAMLGFNVKAQHDTNTSAEHGLAEVLSVVEELTAADTMEHAE